MLLLAVRAVRDVLADMQLIVSLLERLTPKLIFIASVASVSVSPSSNSKSGR